MTSWLVAPGSVAAVRHASMTGRRAAIAAQKAQILGE
jgi:hypothetical protein